MHSCQKMINVIGMHVTWLLCRRSEESFAFSLSGKYETKKDED